MNEMTGAQTIQKITAEELSGLSVNEPNGVVVIMPCTDPAQGVKTAEVLYRRAEMPCHILVIHDTPRQGFIKTVNDAAAAIQARYIVYLAQDAYPGRGWLRCAYDTLEKSGKGLLAFNDGKWHGRIAAFGMVRTDWVKTLYAGEVFYPGYISHAADNELTVIARCQDMHAYNPDCTLVEYDQNKDFGGSNPKDKALFQSRFLRGFDGRIPFEKLESLAAEYKVVWHCPETHHGVSVILAIHTNADQVDHFLCRFFEINTHSPVEVIVIDRGAEVRAGEVVAKHAVRGFIRHIEQAAGHPLIRCLTHGAARARYPYLYIIKDAVYTKDVLSAALSKLEEPGVGAVSTERAEQPDPFFIFGNMPSYPLIDGCLCHKDALKGFDQIKKALGKNELFSEIAQTLAARAGGQAVCLWENNENQDSPPEERGFDDAARLDVAHRQMDPELLSQKIIVYTSNFGDYEPVKDPVSVDPRVDYVLFTDKENMQSRNWRVIRLNEKLETPRRTSRLPKILPHKYLPPHDISVYIDSSLQIKEGDVYRMVQECLGGREIALYRHYWRDCLYDEIDFCANSPERPVDKKICADLKLSYQQAGYPRNAGLFENALIVRKNTEPIQKLNEKWWEAYAQGPERDQLTFMYCLWQTGVRPSAIQFGEQFRSNPYVNFISHKYRVYSNATPDGTSWAQNAKNNNPASSRAESPRPSDAAPTVNWVIGADGSEGWAYENNANRLIQEISDYRHGINLPAHTPCAVYFDALVHERTPVSADTKILRVGGPRPLNRLYGNNDQLLMKGLESFTAVICLNREMTGRLERLHPNVHCIPNGIDLDTFHPGALKKNRRKGFVAGFAGSIKSAAERDTKGYDLAVAACRQIGAELLSVGRGKGQTQIPHEKMIDAFYSRIDVLLHPVGPGREGSSNVIMEALALGIPVVTTKHAGFHGESLQDHVDALICERDVDSIAAALAAIRKKPRLARKLGKNGRAFAETQHAISRIAIKYKKIIDQAAGFVSATCKVSFLPFWLPAHQFASSRLRSLYPSRMLAGPGCSVGALPVHHAQSNIMVVVQSCTDDTLNELKKREDAFVIYDVCDKYYTDEKIFNGRFGVISSLSRLHELMAVSDMVITPTRTLKGQIAMRFPHKPVFYMPEPIDYIENMKNATDAKKRTVLWFGNPGRGNFESARWILDYLVEKYKCQPLIISKRKYFKNEPFYHQFCSDWDYDLFSDTIRQATLCVVTHHPEEPTKSPNRLITAISHGIPTIVSGSPSCEGILRAADCQSAIISTFEDIDRFMAKIRKSGFRRDFIRKTQKVVSVRHGWQAVKKNYQDLFRHKTYRKSRLPRALKIGCISHNLNLEEGAPTSLAELCVGLKTRYGIDCAVFSISSGPLKDTYLKHGISCTAFHSGGKANIARIVNENFESLQNAFQEFLDAEAVDLVVANTAKAAPLVASAKAYGLSVISIIRESYGPENRFSYFKKPLQVKAVAGLRQADTVIFVSRQSEQAWQDFFESLDNQTQVIHNGIDPSRFEALRHAGKRYARMKLGIAEDRFVLLNVGTIGANKNQVELLDGFAQIPEADASKMLLAFVGARDGAGLKEFKQKFKQLDPLHRQSVRVFEKTDDIGLFYKAADILCVNSKIESYPRVVIEALFFGLPVVATPCYGMTAQIEHGSNGLFYDFGDMKTWQRHVETLFYDPQRLAAMSENAKNSFWQLTTYTDMLHQYYCQILNAIQKERWPE